MGVTVGTCWDTGANGWTVITPSGTPQNGFNTGAPSTSTTMILYVSSSGSDSTSSTEGSSTNPYQTIGKALSMVRAGSPDWILLKRGDAFTGNWTPTAKGKSATEPMVIGTYDPTGTPFNGASTVANQAVGNRPLLRATASAAGSGILYFPNNLSSSLDFIAIMGIEFYAYTRDPASPNFTSSDVGAECYAIRTLCANGISGPTWFLVEDCKGSYFQKNFDFENNNAPYAGKYIFRRNVSIYGQAACVNTASVPNAGGIYISGANDWLFEENVFDHNGWDDRLSGWTSVTTYTTANPAVFTWPNAYVPRDTPGSGSQVVFQTTVGSFTAGTPYYVVNVGGSTFSLSTTRAGAGITGAGLSGTLSMRWISLDVTLFNHNVYVQEPYPVGAGVFGTNGSNVGTFRSNMELRSPAGSQGRSVKFYDDNCFVECTYTINSNCDFAGQTVTYQNSVIIEGVKHFDYLNNYPSGDGPGKSQGPRTTGNNLGTLIVQNNIIANTEIPTDIGSYAIGFEHAGLTSTTAKALNNIIFNWGNSFIVSGAGNSGDGAVFMDSSNTSTDTGNQRDLAGTNVTYNYPGYPADHTAAHVKNLLLETYASVIGVTPATVDGFAAQAQLQGKSNWRTNLTANAVNNWIRAGFGVAAYPSGAGTVLSPSSLPNGTVGTPYPTQTITASGGTGPYTFSSSPSPPFPGVTLTSGGVLSGTPTTANPSYSFTVTATDSLAATGNQSYTVTISAAAPPPSGTQLMGQACL